MVQMNNKNDWMTGVREWLDSVTHPNSSTKKKQKDDWIRQEFEDQAAAAAAAAAGKNKETLQPTISEGKDAWIARDMAKAGKAEEEDESSDWVAKDMNRVGRDPSHQDVQWEMKDAGAGGSFQGDVLKKNNKRKDQKSGTNVKSKNDLIQEDMKRVGLSMSSDRIQRDMEDAGRGPREEENTPTDKVLRDRLLRKQDEKYKDVYNGMKKAGEDATRVDLIATRMKSTGQGETIRSAGKEDYSYKLDKHVTDHYDIDGIRTDMEQAGHAESQDWVRHEMEDAGRSHDNVRAKEQPLKHALNRNVPSDIMADLERTGKAGMSEEWIVKDMERAGHPDVQFHTAGTPVKSHKDRETEEFMATRKSPKGPEEDEETRQEVPKEKRRISKIVMKVLNRVIRPWAYFTDLWS